MATVSVPFAPVAPIALICAMYLSYAVESGGSCFPQPASAKSIARHSSMHKYFAIFFIVFTLTFVRCDKN